MNQSELISYLVLLGIKRIVTHVFSYHKTEMKLIYVNKDKLIVRTHILYTYTGVNNNTLETVYPYPVTLEQLKNVLN